MNRLEVPVFSPSSARQVAALGAHRIELNAAGSYADGGLTPSLAELSELLAATSASDGSHRVPVRIMIRPRGPPPGPHSVDFIYTPQELETGMYDAIVAFKETGLLDPELGDGFVFGILKQQPADAPAGVAVDVDRNRDLVRLARPFTCVFHRAFDDVVGSRGGGDAPLGQALDDVVACGFSSILTSGGPGNAPDNVETLRRIVHLASARDIDIIAGGGIRARNAVGIIHEALASVESPDRRGGGVLWLHSSCLGPGVGSGSDHREIDRLEATKLLKVLGHD